MSSTVNTITIEMKAISATTFRGFGIVVGFPFHAGGMLCWFRDPEAFAVAQQSVKQTPPSQTLDCHVLRLAERYEAFRSGDDALKALLDAAHSKDSDHH